MTPTPAQLAARVAELEAQVARLVEDRARFPDRPDDIGRMIGAHYENLKAIARTNENAWHAARLSAEANARDAERLDFVMHRVSGKEWRRIGVRYSDNCSRAAIDAALSAQGADGPKE